MTAGSSGRYLTVSARASMMPSDGQLEGSMELGSLEGASSSHLCMHICVFVCVWGGVCACACVCDLKAGGRLLLPCACTCA